VQTSVWLISYSEQFCSIFKRSKTLITLQLAAVRHLWQSAPASAGSDSSKTSALYKSCTYLLTYLLRKRCSTSCYRYPTSWVHHIRLEGNSSAASATAHWVEAGCFGRQSAEWPVSATPGGWLPTYHYYRPSTTSIRQCHYEWGTKNSSRFERSHIHCCWSASMEQPTFPST